MRVAPLVGLALLGAAFAGCVSSTHAADPLQNGRIVPGAPAAPTSPGWASPADAKIRPGVMIHTAKGDCPANFVFTSADNRSVFVGTTSYCVRALPIGSIASLGTNDTVGVLVYSSFQTMAEIHETDPNTLNYNDFAVFYVDSHDRKWVSPSMLHYGGPTGAADFAAMGVGQRVRSFVGLDGDAPEPLQVREGIVAAQAGSWAYLVYGIPTLPGQMGGGVTTPEGKAVGIVVNVGLVPNPGANGVARLDTLLGYAKEHAKLDMVLASAPLDASPILDSTPTSQS